MHPHVFHICINEQCECHSRRRYDGYDSEPSRWPRTRTQRMALTHLGKLDLRALMKHVQEKQRGT